jgi:hypothetical protein
MNIRQLNPHPCKRRKGAAPVENFNLAEVGVWERGNLSGTID